MLKALVVLSGFLFSALVQGQYSYDFNERCIHAYESILSLRFEEGNRLIKLEQEQNPGNNIPYLLENYRIFLTLAIGENEKDYNLLKQRKDVIFSRLKNGDKTSPYYNYCLAEAYLQWAVARIKFGDYISALQDINRAYRLLVQNHEKFPGFMLNMIDLGVLHTMIGTIPDNYGWIKGILGIEGTVEQGVDELFTVLEVSMSDPEYAHLKAECLFYLAFIQLNLMSEKSKALKYADYFTAYYDLKTSPLVVYSVARIYMNNGLNAKALDVLLSRPTGENYYPFHYLDYLTGVAKLNHLEPDAVIYLLRYVINFGGINYIKSAYQKIAWFYLIEGDTANYHEYMKKVLRFGGKMTDSDKQAEREAEKGLMPNVVLLKARLLFDGGYYPEAEKELLTSHLYLTGERDSLEMYYRLGRIYHGWGKTGQAVKYYETAIMDGAASEYYYAANAALQLGLIHEEGRNYEKALYYYKAAQNMKNEEYRNSISQKAKAGIDRIENRRNR
ncbi:MAG: hypothetical protein JXA03_09920 [Bacteroidales bacterium]|nr:hypothetical protein [Bacteroidales bacterium]